MRARTASNRAARAKRARRSNQAKPPRTALRPKSTSVPGCAAAGTAVHARSWTGSLQNRDRHRCRRGAGAARLAARPFQAVAVAAARVRALMVRPLRVRALRVRATPGPGRLALGQAARAGRVRRVAPAAVPGRLAAAQVRPCRQQARLAAAPGLPGTSCACTWRSAPCGLQRRWPCRARHNGSSMLGRQLSCQPAVKHHAAARNKASCH